MRPFPCSPAVLKNNGFYGQLVAIKSHGKCYFLCVEHLVSVFSMVERGLGIKEHP